VDKLGGRVLCGIRDDDGLAARHRLQHYHPFELSEAREHERAAGVVGKDEVVERQLAEKGHVGGDPEPLGEPFEFRPALADPDEVEMRVGAPLENSGHCADQGPDALPRVKPADEEEARAVQSVLPKEGCGVALPEDGERYAITDDRRPHLPALPFQPLLREPRRTDDDRDLPVDPEEVAIEWLSQHAQRDEPLHDAGEPGIDDLRLGMEMRDDGHPEAARCVRGGVCGRGWHDEMDDFHLLLADHFLYLPPGWQGEPVPVVHPGQQERTEVVDPHPVVGVDSRTAGQPLGDEDDLVARVLEEVSEPQHREERAAGQLGVRIPHHEDVHRTSSPRLHLKNYLGSAKTPFIVVANKLDLVPGYRQKQDGFLAGLTGGSRTIGLSRKWEIMVFTSLQGSVTLERIFFMKAWTISRRRSVRISYSSFTLIVNILKDSCMQRRIPDS